MLLVTYYFHNKENPDPAHWRCEGPFSVPLDSIPTEPGYDVESVRVMTRPETRLVRAARAPGLDYATRASLWTRLRAILPPADRQYWAE